MGYFRQCKQQFHHKRDSDEGSDHSDHEQEKVDTNIFSIKFTDQQQCEQEAIQEPIIYCQGCQAILHAQSQLLTKVEYETLQQNQKKVEKAADEEEKKNAIQLQQQQIQQSNNSESLQQNQPEQNQANVQQQQNENQTENSEKTKEQSLEEKLKIESENTNKTVQQQQQQASNLTDAQKQQLLAINNDQVVWICEFCAFHNKLSNTVKLPSKGNPCYLIQKNKQDNQVENQQQQQEEVLVQKVAVQEQAKNAEQETDDVTIIFCIDLSGSMDTTVRGANENYLKNKNKKQITRLDCVKECIKDELAKMKQKNSTAIVGLVTFSDQVHLLGDGESNNKQNIVFQGNILDSYDALVMESQKHHATLFQKNIQSTCQNLRQVVDDLVSSGSTALGPALLSSVVLASHGKPGSKVIICTDGLANLGIGSIENNYNYRNNNNSNKSTKFYTDVGVYAAEKGVSVSVVTIKGDQECSIKNLGQVTSRTNGGISRVDPTKLGTEFSKLIEDELLCTKCNLKIRLNKLFKFRNEDTAFLKDNGSFLEKEMGNITKETELTYEFDVRSKKQALNQGITQELFQKERLPMQFQLTYQNKFRDTYLQIFTDWRYISFEADDEKLEGVNIGLFAARGQQNIANLAQKGDFQNAYQATLKYQKFLDDNISNADKEQQKKILKFKEKNIVMQKSILSKLEQQQNNQQQQQQQLQQQGKYNFKNQKQFDDDDDDITQKKPVFLQNQQIGQQQQIVQQQISQQQMKQSNQMQEDEAEECLFQNMRARSHSYSDEEDEQKKKF